MRLRRALPAKDAEVVEEAKERLGARRKKARRRRFTIGFAPLLEFI